MNSVTPLNTSPSTPSSDRLGLWYVYIIEASDGRLYTGITNNPERRWHDHCGGKKGAKFFRGRRPQQLQYLEEQADRSSASRREAQIKRLARSQKLLLIEQQQHVDWHTYLNLHSPVEL